MKNQKINRSILKCLLILLVMMGLTGCNSEEQPLPEEYAGIYGSGQYGNLIVTTTNVSTNQLLLPQCVVGNTTIYAELVKWDPVGFTYYTDKTFYFEPYVVSLTSSSKGYAKFSGSF